ncbi:hypothetical protein EDC38_2942 [Marinimicrobium koreense]|uniref:Uncharacterized protein n=1 Tax=Marinimicrobium koreense TaxID=306545 RepID=A0A3N1NTY9_9GAMM|nr:hypothetical protein [Marinimicrobium koreense]ROQ17970.1 hypothetical protein EDC38_2942 [Marinimicrobium koreense]
MTERAQSDLAYIRELMSETRRAACISGGYFIVWGVVVSAGLLLTWLQVVGVLPYAPYATWVPCMILGMLGNVILVRRDRREPVQSYAGRLVGMVWVALGITQLLFFFVGLGQGALPGAYLPAVFGGLIAVGIFLTGILAGLGWLRNMAFGWWLGSLAMFIWPGETAILLMGVLLLLFYVLPGVLLIRMRHHRLDAVGA